MALRRSQRISLQKLMSAKQQAQAQNPQAKPLAPYDDAQTSEEALRNLVKGFNPDTATIENIPIATVIRDIAESRLPHGSKSEPPRSTPPKTPAPRSASVKPAARAPEAARPKTRSIAPPPPSKPVKSPAVGEDTALVVDERQITWVEDDPHLDAELLVSQAGPKKPVVPDAKVSRALANLQPDDAEWQAKKQQLTARKTQPPPAPNVTAPAAPKAAPVPPPKPRSAPVDLSDILGDLPELSAAAAAVVVPEIVEEVSPEPEALAADDLEPVVDEAVDEIIEEVEADPPVSPALEPELELETEDEIAEAPAVAGSPIEDLPIEREAQAVEDGQYAQRPGPSDSAFVEVDKDPIDEAPVANLSAPADTDVASPGESDIVMEPELIEADDSSAPEATVATQQPQGDAMNQEQPVPGGDATPPPAAPKRPATRSLRGAATATGDAPKAGGRPGSQAAPRAGKPGKPPPDPRIVYAYFIAMGVMILITVVVAYFKWWHRPPVQDVPVDVPTNTYRGPDFRGYSAAVVVWRSAEKTAKEGAGLIELGDYKAALVKYEEARKLYYDARQKAIAALEPIERQFGSSSTGSQRSEMHNWQSKFNPWQQAITRCKLEIELMEKNGGQPGVKKPDIRVVFKEADEMAGVAEDKLIPGVQSRMKGEFETSIQLLQEGVELLEAAIAKAEELIAQNPDLDYSRDMEDMKSRLKIVQGELELARQHSSEKQSASDSEGGADGEGGE